MSSSVSCGGCGLSSATPPSGDPAHDLLHTAPEERGCGHVMGVWSCDRGVVMCMWWSSSKAQLQTGHGHMIVCVWPHDSVCVVT